MDLKKHDLINENLKLRKEISFLKEKLEKNSATFLNMVGKSIDGIIVLNKDKMVIYVNYSALDLFGRNIADFLGEPIEVNCDLGRLFHDEKSTIEMKVTKGDGSFSIAEVSIMKKKWNEDPCFVINFRNVTDRKKSEKMLEYMSHHDHLTALPNRVFFEKQMEVAILEAKKRNNHMALLYLDLDNFKMVNDTLGHDVGDLLLQEVSSILKGSIRSTDNVARLGGDEFAIILSDLNDSVYAATVARKILDKLSQTFNLDGREIYTNASIGIAVYPFAGENTIDLVKNADSAMYNAKQNGKNQYRFHSKELSQNNEINLLIINKLRDVIKKEALFLEYQPIIDLGTGQCCGAESLLRWKDSDLGLIAPDKFIPFAEETGLIFDFGRFVIKQALSDYKKLDLDSSFFISVNMSASELDDLKAAEVIQEVMHNMNMESHQLILELTGTSVMRNPENAIKKFNKLSEMGVLIAVDDFGTGYSSLAYLKQLPLFALKIDKSFVDDIGKNSNNEVIVKTTIQLAHSLGLRVIAEGVENENQAVFLKENKCDYIQGFYYSKPLSFKELKKYINKTNKMR